MPILESVCPLDCPDTCSLSVTVDNGRLTRVDGSRRNPFTAGFICAKVRRYPERVYSPLRVGYPQRRVGPKGEGRFERIAWAEAIDIIAQRLRAVIASDGPEAILPYHYGGSCGLFSEGAVDARFFNALGASELLKTICAAPTGTVVRAMYGTMGGVPPQDYPQARAILLWGVNPAVTSIHLVPQIRAAQRAGAFVAVIDPRRTPLAAAAHVHLPILPGTDVVLALAIIRELGRRGAVDQAFIDQHVDGYAQMRQAAEPYTLERAAGVCGVAVQQIVAVIDAYTAASPAVIRCGWGVERNRNGGHAVQAILALPAIAGKFGVRGGGFTMSLSRAFPIDAAALAKPELRRRPARQINMVQLGRVLTEEQSPPVRALFVYNANPVAVTPDQNRIVRGLARDDLFTVVHDQVMTDTARYADVVLPATSVFERPELHKSYGHFFLQYSDAVIEPVDEARSNAELFVMLARAMGLEGVAAGAGADELMRAALDVDATRVGGMTPATLQRDRIAAVRFRGGSEALVQFGTDFPTTRSGKVELCPPELGTPTYTALDSGFPLTLISPASRETINSIFGERPRRDALLHLHPLDAARRGVSDGDVVRIFNALGEVRVRACIDDGMRPGVAALPKGLWRASTLNGATATALVPDHLTDLGGGACFNDARVEVERCLGA